MKTHDDDFFKYIKDFLTIYLPKQKCYSSKTIESYKTAINLLLDFLKDEKGVSTLNISFEHMNYTMILEFLEWLQDFRNCSTSTRNQRLMALKSFFKYAATINPIYISIQLEVSKVPVKKAPEKVVEYLSEAELKTLLEQPDTTTLRGIRDSFFMILMYDIAARNQEVLDLKICDIVFDSRPMVYILGKGSKMRVVPISKNTAEYGLYYLSKLHPIETRKNDDYVFYTAIHGQRHPMSPDNSESFIKKYGEAAQKVCPAIPNRVHPHQLRHSRAMHLYRNGMPLPLLQQFLGHADMQTTLIYAYADTEMKREAIEKADKKSNMKLPQEAIWKNDDEMIRKLCGLK
ncbi:MAG: tyrosine-type recombinase/integrase [Sedimentibacter sp.]